MKHLYSLFLAFFLTGVLFSTAAAQTNYGDTQFQISGNGYIEHYIFWKEYKNAMNSSEGARRLTWWADANMNYYASISVNSINQVRPPQNAAMSNLPMGSETADLKIRQGLCPVFPEDTLGCMDVTLWYNNNFQVRSWRTADIWIRPNTPGTAVWTSESRVAVIAHEIMHVYGAGEQYNLSDGSCNSSVFSLMDGVNIHPTTKVISHCDNITVPAGLDVTNWHGYKIGGYYVYDTVGTWGDGTVTIYLYDHFWNDFQVEVDWQWGNSGPTGVWFPFRRQSYSNFNGSHSTVPGANSLRAMAWENPGFYGVHNKHLRVCYRAIYNYAEVQPFDGSQCTYLGFYPY